MNQLYHLVTPYKCKYCGQDMLFFETQRKTVIDYKAFLDKAFTLTEMKGILRKRNISYIRCIQCGRSDIIDWSGGWPKQMTVDQIKKFGL